MAPVLDVKLYFFTFAFPPLRYPRSIQISRLIKYLDRPVHLICGDERGEKDASIAPEIDKKLAYLIRIKRPIWQDWLTAAVNRIAPWLNQMPDVNFLWSRIATSRFLKISPPNQSDILVTFGQPMSNHLAGLQIKRKTGVKWAVHFSDPWIDNPFFKRGRAAHRINRLWEMSVIHMADTLLFPSREMADLVMRKYPANLSEKAHVIPHAYDPELFTREANVNAGREIVLRYIGTLYLHRHPNSLFLAVRKLIDSDPSLIGRFRIEFVGAIPDACFDFESYRRLPNGLIVRHPEVNYATSLSLMKNSDGLLTIDAPAKKNVFFPSKLADYIGSGRPILGITPPGVARDIIIKLGGFIAEPDDPDAIADALKKFLETLPSFRKKTWGEANARTAYDISKVEKIFSDIISRLEKSNQETRQESTKNYITGNKKHLAIIISSLECGGAERVASLLSSYWCARGWRITLITFSHESKKPFYRLHTNTQHLPLDISRLSHNPIIGFLNAIYGVAALRQSLKLLDPDIVLSFGDTTNIRILLAGMGLKIPIIASERSDPAFAPLRRIWKLLRHITYFSASYIVVQSRGAKNYFSILPEKKLAIIPNPVSITSCEALHKKTASQRLTIVSMGRLSEEKRFDLLLKAFADLRKKYPNCDLRIYGEGPLRPQLEKIAKLFGMDPKHTLPGRTSHTQKILSQADIYVLSSRFEGFPNALCEAMAAGLAVIATDCPSGPREIIRNGVDGLLIPNENSDALAEAMGKLITDATLRRRLGSEATHVSNRFAIEKIHAMWEALFHRAIQDASNR